MLGEYAFRISRLVGKHPIAGVLFCSTERLLPVKRIAREKGLVAFHHPRPIANPHILIIPTRPISSITTSHMDDEAKAKTLWNMISLARQPVFRVMSEDALMLLINGGSRQDIGQLHGHLLPSDCVPDNSYLRLVDPQSELTAWVELMQQLRTANAIPDTGFSLIFQWNSRGEVMAEVTTSSRT